MIGRTVPAALIALACLSAAACVDPDSRNWADRGEIIRAAERCGVPNFEPTRAGAAWAAYVNVDVPDHKAKEDCIYADMKARGRLVTR